MSTRTRITRSASLAVTVATLVSLVITGQAPASDGNGRCIGHRASESTLTEVSSDYWTTPLA